MDEKPQLEEWALTQGVNRHDTLTTNSARTAADKEQLFDVLYASTALAAFAELREAFESAVKAYNEGCGFPDLWILRADDARTLQTIDVRRRHVPRFTLIIDLAHRRRNEVLVQIEIDSEWPFEKRPPRSGELRIPMQVDATRTRVEFERSAFSEAKRILEPFIAL